MTKSAFRQAMGCGLGRCVLALRQLDDPLSFYDTVLWGCVHNMAYDAQSEGTRAYYMWSLVRCFDDITPFAAAVAEKFRTCRSNSGWTFAHYSELLGYFAQNGSQLAREVLQDRYRNLYDCLEKRRCLPSVFPERDDFEQLCMVRIQEGLDSYLVIAEDIGRLILTNPLYGDDTFEQLDAKAEHLFGRRRTTALLKRAAGENPAIAAYWMTHRRSGEQRKAAQTTRMAEAANAIRNSCFLESMSALDLLVVRTYLETGGEKASVRYAAAALAAGGNRRAEMLHNWRIASGNASWPFSAETLLQMAMDGSERSRVEAMAILENTPGPAAHEEALRLIEKAETIEKGVALLCQNYRPTDRTILTAAVRSLPVSRVDDRWHTAYMSVLELFQRKGQKGLPKALMTWIYGHSLCSCCRKAALWEMGRRRMLTRAILEECRYDSSEEIRLYAKRRTDAKKKGMETI